MRSDDHAAHLQMAEFVKSARKALDADRVVIVIEFWDEVVETPTTMTMTDSRNPDESGEAEAAGIINAMSMALNSALGPMGAKLVITNSDGKEIADFSNDDTAMVEIDNGRGKT